MKYSELVVRACKKLAVLAAGEDIPASILADGLVELNAIFDTLAAREIAAFNVNFSLFTLAANHSPTRIGPGLAAPDFNTGANTIRPIRIESAAWVLSTGGQAVDTPMLNIRDDDWWAANRLKSLTSSIATDLYYSPDFPNGSLYFWPIPTVSNQVRLEMWGQLPQAVTGVGTFSLPPGYWEMITWELAFAMAPMFGPVAIISDDMRESRRYARRIVEGNNSQSPRISTAQPGMKPSRSGGRADFNWADGEVV